MTAFAQRPILRLMEALFRMPDVDGWLDYPPSRTKRKPVPDYLRRDVGLAEAAPKPRPWPPYWL